MTPKSEAWLNAVLSSAAIGLASYQTAVSTGATVKSAAITGAIAFVGALQGHFRQDPSAVGSTPPPATPEVVAAASVTKP